MRLFGLLATRRRRIVTALALFLAIGALFAGCNGCYYAHVAVGEAHVILGREAIEDALSRPSDLSADERARLTLVPEIRQWAIDKVGLTDNGSYHTFYDTGAKPISWNVGACAKTAFTQWKWSYPFVGEAPYKGFFDLDEAKAEADSLRARGLDVRISEVTAYSTLGWFKDPIFRRMLDYGTSDFAQTLVHEMTHATVFREGDADFNESLATFVGNLAGLQYLEAKVGPDGPEVKAAHAEAHDEALFGEFIDDLFAKLSKLYDSDATSEQKLAKREAIFTAAQAEFEEMRKARFLTQSYAGFSKRKLDNCLILSFRTYHFDLGAFQDVYDLCGRDWKKSMEVFRDAAAVKTGTPRGFMAEWRSRQRMARRAGA